MHVCVFLLRQFWYWKIPLGLSLDRSLINLFFSHSSYPKFDYTCDVLCFELVKPQTKEWDQNDPHSALLRNANDQIVCFFFYINFVLSWMLQRTSTKAYDSQERVQELFNETLEIRCRDRLSVNGPGRLTRLGPWSHFCDYYLSRF